MPKWNLHELVERQQGVVSLFLSDTRQCSRKAKAKFDRTLDHLVQVGKQEWKRPASSPLGNDIYVIRFTDETRKQLRVFGYFHDPHNCFVMTLTGWEKDDQYYPAEYLRILEKQKESLSKNFFHSSQPFDGRCYSPVCTKEV